LEAPEPFVALLGFVLWLAAFRAESLWLSVGSYIDFRLCLRFWGAASGL